MHMVFHDGYFMGGMHWVWWIFWLALIGFLAFYKWRRPGDRRHGPRETPHEVLKRRLANGEISAQEYEQRKALLDRDAGAK